jgi:hypothetical protein
MASVNGELFCWEGVISGGEEKVWESFRGGVQVQNWAGCLSLDFDVCSGWQTSALQVCGQTDLWVSCHWRYI